jgi:hypothetical protein
MNTLTNVALGTTTVCLVFGTWACISDDLQSIRATSRPDAGMASPDGAASGDTGVEPKPGVLFFANFDKNCGFVQGNNGGTITFVADAGQGGTGACRVCASTGDAGSFVKGAAVSIPSGTAATAGTYTFSYEGRGEGMLVKVQTRADIGDVSTVSAADLTTTFTTNASTVVSPEDAGGRNLVFNLSIDVPPDIKSACIVMDNFLFERQ